jgi:peptidoglycan hydrolase CwlO-like protein
MKKWMMWVGGLVFVTISGLASLLYTAQCERDANQEKDIDRLEEKKVDNQTMQMNIRLLEKLMEERKEQQQRVWEEIKELKKE